MGISGRNSIGRIHGYGEKVVMPPDGYATWDAYYKHLASIDTTKINDAMAITLNKHGESVLDHNILTGETSGFSLSWFTDSMFMGIPNWVLVLGGVVGVGVIFGRR